MSRKLFYSILITLIYWIPASMELYDIITDDGILFPQLIDFLLTPGYILGFGFGYAGGSLYAIFGQIIAFIIILTIVNRLFSLNSKSNP